MEVKRPNDAAIVAVDLVRNALRLSFSSGVTVMDKDDTGDDGDIDVDDDRHAVWKAEAPSPAATKSNADNTIFCLNNIIRLFYVKMFQSSS